MSELHKIGIFEFTVPRKTIRPIENNLEPLVKYSIPDFLNNNITVLLIIFYSRKHYLTN